ncbi:putative molibdopterin-dependent oxidoreductase YjgC [Neorhizobium huautlense]|uniref:Molibdopterin-dependent oxidoreductase YjgC n=1 Tax=Neorhizobium huautlense TaxID=67774 RepID=A0ABT9Q216_9HYPH|nr:(2Fe-2S)-binding protein [Neorhizobium huautlense]MDP9840396.1 putative molibdopterin-dependent oxidoreductase YjgC [Neorhizobium huautlense]
MFKKIHDPSPNSVTVHVDGMPVCAEPGENAATVLLRQAELWVRTTPVSEKRRAPYCMMGVCFDCLALVDGALVQTCLAPVRDGMTIERQLGRRSVAS